MAERATPGVGADAGRDEPLAEQGLLAHMKPSRIEGVLRQVVRLRWPAFVWGPPGVGKSSVVRQVADLEGLPLRDIRASLLDPTDLRGIPTITDGRAVWCPPAFLPQRARARPEFCSSTRSTRRHRWCKPALYQLVLDRQIGEYRLPDGWRIIAAGNRQEDRAVIFRLSSALANRFIHLSFDIDYDDWRKWALLAQGSPVGDRTPGTAPRAAVRTARDSPAYPTPRSWEMVSDVLHAAGGLDGLCRCAAGYRG